MSQAVHGSSKIALHRPHERSTKYASQNPGLTVHFLTPYSGFSMVITRHWLWLASECHLSIYHCVLGTMSSYLCLQANQPSPARREEDHLSLEIERNAKAVVSAWNEHVHSVEMAREISELHQSRKELENLQSKELDNGAFVNSDSDN